MGDAAKNFSWSEFRCKHCGKVDGVDPKLIIALQKLRDLTKRTITITSAYRCPEHKLSKSNPTSQHTLGKAADIRIKGYTVKQMYEAAKMIPEFKNGGIGLYPENFIHVDIRGVKARWCRIYGRYMDIEEFFKRF